VYILSEILSLAATYTATDTAIWQGKQSRPQFDCLAIHPISLFPQSRSTGGSGYNTYCGLGINDALQREVQLPIRQTCSARRRASGLSAMPSNGPIGHGRISHSE
jgi:hypothetical protein